MSGARSCTATFTDPPDFHTLTVTRNGSGTGTVTSNPAGINCGSDCSHTYVENTVVTLTASAGAGSVFDGWSGHSDCLDGVVTMSGARSCTATFTDPPDFHTLTVTRNGTGTGTVTSSPAGINCGSDCTHTYVENTVVTLTANAGAGSVFDGWSGHSDCLDGVVTMSGARSCTATFAGSGSAQVLLVDDDDNTPDVRGTYTSALDALGIGYDVWDTGNSDNEPSAGDLAGYSWVVWFTGDSFTEFAGPGSSGETDLGQWLDGGGCLFLSSQDYHFVRGLTAFMSSYLGIDSVSDDVGQTTATGTGSDFGGLGPYTLSYPFSNFSDRLSPAAGAQLAFFGDQGDAGVAKSASYQTIFLGFPFEAIPVEADRHQLMSRISGFCDGAIFRDGFESGNFSSWSQVVP